MDYRSKIEKLVRKQKGTILSADVDLYQIPRTYLQMMVAEGSLERVERGVYIATDAIEDEMYYLQIKYSTTVYSHETALFLHGLSDRTPFEYSVSVPSGYKVVKGLARRCKVYYIKNELHEMGLEMMNSPHGNLIKSYDIERTICDMVRSRGRIDVQIFTEALKRFTQLKSVDFKRLMNYAEKLRVANIMRHYLEILL